MSNLPISSGKLKVLKNFFKRQSTVSIIIDGPNMLRKTKFNQIKLEDIEEAASKLGSLSEKYVVLNRFASESLIQAVINSGYTPIHTTEDVYLEIGLLSLNIAKRKNCDVLMIASRDARCGPILMKVKEKGLKTGIIGFDPGFSVSLKNTADFALELLL